MQDWSISVTKWLVWFLLALGILVIGHVAASAQTQPIPEVIQPGPLLIDEPDPTAKPELTPIAEPENGVPVEIHEGVETCERVGSCGCGVSGGHGFWCRWFHGTCDMPQHHAYFPPMHGYYYFRPYHPGHVSRQQQFMTQFGGDPRHPYANRLFKKIYAEYEADRQAKMSSRTYRLPPAPKAPRIRR